MISLSVPAYVLLVFFCVYSAGGIEYGRQRWVKSRSPWELARIFLASGCLVAVVVAMPMGGPQLALYPVLVAGVVNTFLTLSEAKRSTRGSGRS